MSSLDTVIVLSAGYDFMGLVSWQRAMLLLFNGKVEVVKESDRVVRTVSRTFRVPAVIRLLKFFRRMYHREVPFSRKNILIRDEHVCQYCGREHSSPDLTLDHIIPKVQSGPRDGPIFLYRPERMLSDKGTLHAATWTSGTVLQ